MDGWCPCPSEQKGQLFSLVLSPFLTISAHNSHNVFAAISHAHRRFLHVRWSGKWREREGGRIVSRSSRVRSPSRPCHILGSIDDQRVPLLSPSPPALAPSLVKVGLLRPGRTCATQTACQDMERGRRDATTAAIGATLKDKNGPPERRRRRRRRRNRSKRRREERRL